MEKIEKAREMYRRLERIDKNSTEFICRKFEAYERLLTIRSC
jgi:hypothetical protein